MNKAFIVISAILAAALVSFLLLRQKGDPAGNSGNGSITYADPSAVLFSVPTIFERAPAVESGKQTHGDKDFGIDEDDWRQIEFVPRQNLAGLTNLLAEVVAFEKANRQSTGWKNTFVRKEYAASLESAHLSFQKLLASFTPLPSPSALFLTSGEYYAMVTGGFSFRVQGLGNLYGRRVEDRVLELGFEYDKANPVSRIGLSELYGYCDQNQLVLVDWYRRQIVSLAAGSPPAR
jgi:hypothetical protein